MTDSGRNGNRRPAGTSRRGFVRYGAMAAVAAQALVRSGDLRAAVAEAREADALAERWPEMTYRTLGRTGHQASRLIFGCGAALARGPRDELLETALEAGVNVFDVGYRDYYNDAEQNLAPFLRRHRDQVFLISKAIVPGEIGPDEQVSAARAREVAAGWGAHLDASLRELGVEHMDAYYLMASNNPQLVTSDEIYQVFERARSAGKVSHLGLSTHQNAQAVLEAAVASGRFDLAMVAVTPGGWYDWETREVLPGSPPMKTLQPLFERARASGMGLIGMKAGRFLAGRRFFGWGNPDAFDQHYDQTLLRARLSEFQRSYAFVLEHGLDAVNADMQTLLHLKENFVAAATSASYFQTA